MLLNCGLEKTLESPWDCREIQPIHSKENQQWGFFARNDAEAETPVLFPPHAKSWVIGKLWCWEVLGAEGEGNDRGWDCWMISPTGCRWLWVNSRSWWWTVRGGVLQSMGSQIVRYNWATELKWSNWQRINLKKYASNFWSSIPGELMVQWKKGPKD